MLAGLRQTQNKIAECEILQQSLYYHGAGDTQLALRMAKEAKKSDPMNVAIKNQLDRLTTAVLWQKRKQKKWRSMMVNEERATLFGPRRDGDVHA